MAETNRAPFDVAEGESELVAGFHVEYGGMAFSIFFMAEYANMVLICRTDRRPVLWVAGCRLSRVCRWSGRPFHYISEPNIIWLLLKTSLFLFMFLWLRATFPRYRYDQIMRLGWKVFLPITIIWIVVISGMVVAEVGPWFN